MRNLLNKPHQLFQPDEAEKVARELTQGDLDGWLYKPVHDPKETGFSFIEIYDEEGQFVSRF